MALNIFVSFADKQVHRVQMVPEKLTWDNLVTILQLSIPQAPPNTDSLALYYRHPVTNATASVSNQTELSNLMDEVKVPYDGLRFSSVPEAAEPLLVFCAFEKLASFVKQHQPLGHFASRWVGVLATYMAMSPEEDFDRELKKLEKIATDGKGCKEMRGHRLGRRHRRSHRRHAQRSEVEEVPSAEKVDPVEDSSSSSDSSSSDDSSEDEFAQDGRNPHRHHPHHRFMGDRFGHHRGPSFGPDAHFGHHRGSFPGPHSRFGPFEDPLVNGFDPKKRMKFMKKFMKHYHRHGHHHGPQGHGPQFFFV